MNSGNGWADSMDADFQRREMGDPDYWNGHDDWDELKHRQEMLDSAYKNAWRHQDPEEVVLVEKSEAWLYVGYPAA
jgi:hypothetical protein